MSPPSHNSSVPKIMVFRPSLEEMKDFPAYIAYMESMGAHKAGIAKIIPPKEFVAAYDYDKLETLTIPAPIQQEVMGHQGLYTQYNIQKKPLTSLEFRKLANSSRYATPPHFDYDDLERKYWKNITYNPPIYAADISGSLYSKGCNIWNINKLNTLLDVIEEEQGVKIEGVNTAYLYFGMWKTTFAWHTEDMDLYSINYLHFGAPKSWYGIPPEHAKRLERLASGFFPQSFQICPNFLRHKMTLISPQILKKYSIPYDKITQETGEFMVTFPYGYHAGYNHGYNCAESTNFASLRWIDFGKRAKCCSCQRDSVKINMEPFIRIFQPHRYDAWKQGKDMVYIEDIDKPSSGMQSQNVMEYNSPRKSNDDGMPLKTRRQPLHKKDGRRVKTGTTSQRKRNHKELHKEDEESNVQTTLIMQQQTASLTTPIVSIEIEPLQAATTVTYSDVPRVLSSLETTVQEDIVNESEEPKPKIPRNELPSPSPDLSESSTLKAKKKTSNSGKGDSKLKKKLSHKYKESRTEHLDSERINAKSKKKHPKCTKEKSKSKNKESKLMRETKPAAEMSIHVSAGVGIHNQTEDHQNVFTSNDGLLKASGKYSHQKTKVKPQKTGLLLEQEKARKKKKLKSQKTALLKLKDGVKREHAYSSSPSNQQSRTTSQTTSSPDLHRNKSNHKKIKLNKLVEKSTKTETNTTEEQLGYLSTDKAGTKVKHEGCMQELLSKSADKMADQNCMELTSKSKAAAKTSGPKGKAKHDFTSQEFATMKVWARSMNGLWVTQPHSYDMELAYNLSMADQRPGCCICMLFYNEKLDGKDWDSNKTACSSLTGQGASIDRHTLVLTPEMCFAATSENRFPDCRNMALTSEGRSVLLHCNQCKIAVHASCYGESGSESDSWKCRRCKEQDYLAECCLCNLRGGALKQTTNGRWAHIVCAMAIPEVTFEDVQAREPINIDKISPARLKLPRDYPLKDICVGQTVIAKHKNSRYYKAEVIADYQQAFYHVKFDDGSYSDNLYPHDIESHDCMRNGPPSEGDAVTVRWTDGLVYRGTFVKSYMVQMYDVEFEDGSVLRVKREDLYSQEEPLPKKVTTKLSTASDMRHENFWENKIVKERHRHVYSLYASSGSEPEDKTSINTRDKAANSRSTHGMPNKAMQEVILAHHSEHTEEILDQSQAVIDGVRPDRTQDNLTEALIPDTAQAQADMSQIEVFPQEMKGDCNIEA
ncbi:lysine-specific demethylase 4A-like isoform X2 [Patiria miniata]|uniref:[histone H3]-trimethyl-L-lysine(9) demethylase n=1 Tax=Patiria miniata TaxID=46514 RepID=A0A914BFV3_PATMI|nr:lysine-specific demethylase 4A-like isoform X2 [Patiria miniata]